MRFGEGRRRKRLEIYNLMKYNLLKPNDKPQQTNDAYEDPKLFIVIGNEKLPRPGLETAFVDLTDDAGQTNRFADSDTSKWVGGAVCTCNKVRVVSCGCVRYKACSHCSHTSSSGGSRSGCRCAPVH